MTSYTRPTDGATIQLNQKQIEDLEDLENEALSTTNESPTGHLLLSAGIFAFAVLPLGPYLAGALISPIVVNGIKKAMRNGRQAVYLRKSGNFAHVLSESQLVQLTRSIGKESVVAQLNEAHSDGQALTKSAKKYLKLAGQEAKKITIDSLFEQSKPESDTPQLPNAQVVNAQTIDITPDSDCFNDLSWGDEDGSNEEDTALSRMLASPYKSRAIFGGQRTGKSNLVAIASSQLAQQGVKIYHINLLSYTRKGDEDAKYTQHCTQSVRADFSHETNSNRRQVIVGQCIQLVQKWWDAPKAILIFDEFAYAAFLAVPETAPLLTLIADKLAAIASSGMKREHALYALSPTMVASELQDSGKRIKSLDPVLVAIAPGHQEEWMGQQLTFNVSLHTEVNRNFGNVIPMPNPAEVPGQSRIAYIDGSWCGLGSDALQPQPGFEPNSGDDLVELLAKFAKHIKKECIKKDGSITVRSVAQCLPSEKRQAHYPRMEEYCQSLAKMYPEEFEVFPGKADELRIAYLRVSNEAKAHE